MPRVPFLLLRFLWASKENEGRKYYYMAKPIIFDLAQRTRF